MPLRSGHPPARVDSWNAFQKKLFRLFGLRRPYRCLAILLLVGYAASALAYVLIAAWVVAWENGPGSGPGQGSLRLLLLPRINDVVVFTFWGVCGASVGSFLNVVVWRLPQGRGVGGHSFCPRCHHRLRVRDNVPVLGWLWLGGRCRDCRLPISSRYPIVEAAVGGSFAVLGTVEMWGGNLPYRLSHGSFATGTPVIDATQLVIVVYHLVGVAIAWAMGLIRYDRHPIPSRLVVFAGVGLIGGMLLFPALAIVPWQLPGAELSEAGLSVQERLPGGTPWPPVDWLLSPDEGFSSVVLVQSIVRVLTALVAAVFFARVLGRGFCRQADLKLDPLGEATLRLVDLVKMIAVVSILVGWQASSGVLIAASLLAWGGQGVFRNTDALGRFSLALPVALLLQLMFWRGLANSGWWPSEQSPRFVLLGYALGTLLIPIWLGEQPPPTGESPSGSDQEPPLTMNENP